jgi:hypothetical protein
LISRNTGKVTFPKKAPTRPVMTVILTAIVLKIVKKYHILVTNISIWLKSLFDTLQLIKLQYTNFDSMNVLY